MPRQITRDELAMMIQEIDRGEIDREQVDEIITALEITIPDDELLDFLEAGDRTAGEIADDLIGYTDE